MPYFVTHVNLPEPPVPMTKLEWRAPKKGDWFIAMNSETWRQAGLDFQKYEERHCFTPKPQPPKKIIGFKKGTRFYKNTALKPWVAITPNGKKWEFGMTTDDYATEILHKLDPSITEFTTLEDGTSL